MALLCFPVNQLQRQRSNSPNESDDLRNISEFKAIAHEAGSINFTEQQCSKTLHWVNN